MLSENVVANKKGKQEEGGWHQEIFANKNTRSPFRQTKNNNNNNKKATVIKFKLTKKPADDDLSFWPG